MGRPIVLHDSLSNRGAPVAAPAQGQGLRIYVCGPTVYDDPHVGNFRTFAGFDVLGRALRHLGYPTATAMNITDIDDKVIRRAAEQGVAPQDLARRYEERFLDDLAAMGIARPDHLPRATDHIAEMVEDIARLIERGIAYSTPDGSVYFRARAFAGYGLLAHQNLEAMRAGARVEPEPGKEADADFALWKGARPGEPHWPAPWGAGRPGWHMECTTMADRILGRPLDIHGGGSDLVFPHHENERAQAEALRPDPFARLWVHTGMLLTDGTKASKSVGNIGSLRELRERYEPMALRLFFLTAHYARPLNLTDEALEAAQGALYRVREVANRARAELRQSPGRTGSEAASADLVAASGAAREAFDRALADDLNAPAAAASLFDFGRLINQAVGDGEVGAEALARALAVYVGLWQVLGIAVGGEEAVDEERVARVEALVAARQAARAHRDFAEADRLRAELDAMGVAIEDTREGARWRWQTERV